MSAFDNLKKGVESLGDNASEKAKKFVVDYESVKDDAKAALKERQARQY